MYFALLSMTWFLMRANLLIENGLAVAWIVLAVASLGMSVRFVQHYQSRSYSRRILKPHPPALSTYLGPPEIEHLSS